MLDAYCLESDYLDSAQLDLLIRQVYILIVLGEGTVHHISLPPEILNCCMSDTFYGHMQACT